MSRAVVIVNKSKCLSNKEENRRWDSFNQVNKQGKLNWMMILIIL